jgi:hypothetical protein
VAIADLNEDSRPDIVTANNLDDNVTVAYSRCLLAVPGDLDGDGTVTAADMGLLLDAWGPCPGPGSCAADLDGDGTVGIVDLLELLTNWG